MPEGESLLALRPNDASARSQSLHTDQGISDANENFLQGKYEKSQSLHTDQGISDSPTATRTSSSAPTRSRNPSIPIRAFPTVVIKRRKPRRKGKKSQSLHTDQGISDCRLCRPLQGKDLRPLPPLPPKIALPGARFLCIPASIIRAEELLSLALPASAVTSPPKWRFGGGMILSRHILCFNFCLGFQGTRAY